jgi:hypothetical protein
VWQGWHVHQRGSSKLLCGTGPVWHRGIERAGTGRPGGRLALGPAPAQAVTTVPAFPCAIASASFSRPITAIRPVAETNRHTASTFGPMEPVGQAARAQLARCRMVDRASLRAHAGQAAAVIGVRGSSVMWSAAVSSLPPRHRPQETLRQHPARDVHRRREGRWAAPVTGWPPRSSWLRAAADQPVPGSRRLPAVALSLWLPPSSKSIFSKRMLLAGEFLCSRAREE